MGKETFVVGVRYYLLTEFPPEPKLRCIRKRKKEGGSLESGGGRKKEAWNDTNPIKEGGGRESIITEGKGFADNRIWVENIGGGDRFY